jgi:cytoskeletal protein RodZ
MVRTKQGGSVLAFIVVGILLLALLSGGIFWISRQNKETHMPPAAPQVSQDSHPSGGSTSAPSIQNHDARQESQESTSSSTPAQLPSGDKASKELPETGPRETVIASIALGLLSGVTVSYLRSRRESISL